MNELIERLALDVIEGRKTMLQVERHLHKRGYANADEMMQEICEVISRRKKGHE